MGLQGLNKIAIAQVPQPNGAIFATTKKNLMVITEL
jgi:hypothetical protein